MGICIHLLLVMKVVANVRGRRCTSFCDNKKESYKVMNQRIIYLHEQYLNQTHNLSKETGFRGRNTVLDWSVWWRAVWVRQRLGCLYVCCLIYLKNGKESDFGFYWPNNKSLQDCVVESCETRKLFTRLHDWAYDDTTLQLYVKDEMKKQFVQMR